MVVATGHAEEHTADPAGRMSDTETTWRIQSNFKIKHPAADMLINKGEACSFATQDHT